MLAENLQTIETTGANARVLELQARIRSMQATTLDSKALPTLPALASILPGGALRQGSVYSLAGSTTLAMALLAAPSAAGSWCGVVGAPDFGIEAAARFGIELERLVLAPSPGDQWLTVTAALADVLTVVVTRPPRRVGDADAARLSARLRQRGATLLVLGDWPGSDATLRLDGGDWQGLGDGHGHLSGREATVTATGRLGFDRPRTARLWLPDAHSAFRAAGSAAATGPMPAGVIPLRRAAGFDGLT
ncbi:hypothetical protein [Microterricola pindariensis]|uniref:Recombinase A n=1 Tax=Microterricola pindariensis TaxID=478010 RepID=A0ABX5AUM9_9MICO|nr:hypothetical protein [Microterricola pindariensis]PPL18139.1 hypothetical protein GY24_10700 [Microterricola pindariensis]